VRLRNAVEFPCVDKIKESVELSCPESIHFSAIGDNISKYARKLLAARNIRATILFAMG
jgi:hypothetical protein